MEENKDNTIDNSEKAFESSNFVQDFISEDLKNGRFAKVHTRFPPEPNGYLHIGHAKAICIDFGMAQKFNGITNLRFDDTNPVKEDVEYVDSIKEDIKWLGFDWGDRLFFASDYFEKLYGYAEELINKGLAYVCDLTVDQIREYRGTLTEPGKESPYRNRSIEENLDLFRKMRAGEFEDGSKVLRAKIDMASPNLNMRDPVIYRIRRANHHRTGDAWCIYPMYDFQHPISDAIEGISHSLCSLEYEDHRPLYEWVVNNVSVETKPRQIEFARLNINYTVMSKRKLLELVQNNYVDGWDDPRMPTLSGLRRRGYTPEAIRDFCNRIGVAKTSSTVDLGILEHCIREDLNKKALRLMAVLKPLKVVIDNYPEDMIEEFEADNNPEDENAGTRMVPFSKVIYIEQDDFMEEPPKGYFRLTPGKEVRLKHAYFVKCENVVKDPATGEIIEVHCTYDPETRGGNAPDGRKVKGTIQWVSADKAVDAEVRLYDTLFSVPDPDNAEGDYKDNLNPDSLEVVQNCKIEPSILGFDSSVKYQFIRTGYFCEDNKRSTKDKLIFNRVVQLKDTWSKINKK